MLATPVPVTLVTVVHPICGVFVERFPKMLKFFTDPNLVAKHLVIINPNDEATASARRAFTLRVTDAFRDLPWNVQFENNPENRWDLPAYNDARDEIRTASWVGISPDTRLMGPNWIERYFEVLDTEAEQPIAMIGNEGPSQTLTPESARAEPRGWGWIPQLLIDRGLAFENCGHIQTWCFWMNSEAFQKVGGFWETPDKKIHGKGDVIASEIYMGVSLRREGFELGYNQGPNLYHYGTRNGEVSLAELDAFDRKNNWSDFV